MHAWRGRRNRLNVVDAFGRLENGVDEDRLLYGVLGFELSQELVEVVDVPWALHLRQHDHVELVTGGGDDFANISQHPRAVEAVDARPQAGRSEVVVARHGNETGPRRLFLIGGNGVLEVAEHDVDLAGDVLDFRANLFVVRGHEMNHALEPHRQHAIRLGSADGERGIKLLRRAAGGHRK